MNRIARVSKGKFAVKQRSSRPHISLLETFCDSQKNFEQGLPTHVKCGQTWAWKPHQVPGTLALFVTFYLNLSFDGSFSRWHALTPAQKTFCGPHFFASQWSYNKVGCLGPPFKLFTILEGESFFVNPLSSPYLTYYIVVRRSLILRDYGGY